MNVLCMFDLSPVSKEYKNIIITMKVFLHEVFKEIFPMKSVLSLHKKMKFSIMDFFSKCDQICSLVTFNEEILMENFIFCAVFESPDSFVIKVDFARNKLNY